MSKPTVQQQIEKIARERHELWLARGNPGAVERCARRLADLYELKRQEAAGQTAWGSPVQIIKRARIESELERLMGGR